MIPDTSTATNGSGSSADFLSFFPSRALEIGRMYKLAADPKEDSLIRQHAREVIEEFRHIVESFPKGTKEHAYMVNFHHSALDYAGSIRRIDRELTDELDSAEVARDQSEQGILETVKHGTLLKVALHYLMIGGLFFFLASAIPDRGAPRPEATTLERYSSELAAGIGSIVFAYIGQGVVLSFRLAKVRRRYDQQTWRSRRAWAHAQVEVHNLSLATVEHEWKEVTGQEPPLSELTRLQIRAVYLGSLAERAPRVRATLGHRIASRLRKARRARRSVSTRTEEAPLQPQNQAPPQENS